MLKNYFPKILFVNFKSIEPLFTNAINVNLNNSIFHQSRKLNTFQKLAVNLVNGKLNQKYETNSRSFCNSNKCMKSEDKKQMLASMPIKDEGTQGEKNIDIDTLVSDKSFKRFPDIESHNILFNGIPFNELPICNIKVSPNNTILSITDHKGKPQFLRSCGIEGFKNTRKGTNIAAQATAISLSVRAIERGLKTVRVRVRGIGPGRMSAIKGLQMGGLEIVSITDNTRVSWNPPRPRKQKKL